jgi:PPE-repeat protein
MTAPVWMAFPPEVHSALLSSGPGPGGLLAAAASWNALSANYASAAEELSGILATVQAGAWEGPTADRYVAAHVPYLAWLVRASANSATQAAQHETAATAYTAALAAMPTMPELAANHATHAALVATNFLGINTIPIALNEADYTRMWVQAATTMSTYQAVATTAVTAAPLDDPPPQIGDPAGNGVQTGADTTGAEFGGQGDAANGILPIVDNDAGDPDDLSWWINRILEPFQTLKRDIELFLQNPLQGITQLYYDFFGVLSDEFGHLIQAIQYFPQVTLLPLFEVGEFAGGFASLTALTAFQPEAAAAPAVVAAPATPSLPAVASSPPAMGAAAAAPASAPTSASAPTASTVASSAPALPAPAPAAGFMPPYAVGPPGIGVDSGMSASASSSAKRKAPERDIAAAAAAAQQAAQARRQGPRRRIDRYRGLEFMELDPDDGAEPDLFPDMAPSAVASGHGAGPLGFAGTAGQETAVGAAGLTTLAGDEFGGGPSVPMLPRTWEREQRDLGEGDRN